MQAQRLFSPKPVAANPLVLEEVAVPEPREHELLLKVRACGVCRTDLHIVEGEINLPKLPVIPGHQIVAVVQSVGKDVSRFKTGDRVGVPWLSTTCGQCEFCKQGKENLCDNARFTGYHSDGGYAEYAVVHENSAYRIPDSYADVQAAPLLCAGVIGYRALKLSAIQPGQRIGLYGFGASAHIALQILKHWKCDVLVFTRNRNHRELAEQLGASWTGNASDAPPAKLDSAVIFAPAGELVPASLRVLKKGGTVALAGIHMSTIPAMEYSLIYEERTVRSVANSTRADVSELLELASTIGIRTEVETTPLREANLALTKLKRSEIRGSAVLLP